MWVWQHSQNASLSFLFLFIATGAAYHISGADFKQADIGIYVTFDGTGCPVVSPVDGCDDVSNPGWTAARFPVVFTLISLFGLFELFWHLSMQCLCSLQRRCWKTYLASFTPDLIGAIMRLVCAWPVIRHTSCNPSQALWVRRLGSNSAIVLNKCSLVGGYLLRPGVLWSGEVVASVTVLNLQ